MNIFFKVIYFFLFSQLAFAQSTYYVSSSFGDDDNNGFSPDSAFQSLTHINTFAASGMFQGGDSILFKRGDEWKGEFLEFGEDVNGENDAPIVLSSFGYGTKPVFNGSIDAFPFDTSQATGITINSPSFNISNLEIKNYSKDGINANVEANQILNLVIDSVFVHNTGSTFFTFVYGIYTEGENTKILNSLITETYNDGIFMLGADCELGFSQIINAGSGPRGDALQLKYADNFWVHDNFMISDDLDHGIAITKQREGEPEFAGGIFERNYCEGNLWGLDVGGYGTIVRYNQFISNRAYGLKIRGHFVKAYDNFISNTEQGIALGSPWVTGLVGYVELYNNTVINTSEYALLLADFTDTVYVSYMNNIFSGIDGSAIKKNRTTILVQDQCNYNLFYPDNKPDLFIDAQNSFSTLSEWQLFTGNDLNSLSDEPMLIDAYCLGDSSPAVDAGINLSGLNDGEYRTDLTGYHRPEDSIWDIGACELADATSLPDTDYSISEIEFVSNVFPNPFNGTTNINFSIPKTEFVKLIIYDILGRKITTLVNGEIIAGNYKVLFDASGLASGVYFYLFKAGDYLKIKNMIHIK